MRENILLPIAKGLVAEHPIPLPINGIPDTIVSEHQVVEVMCVKARHVIGSIAKAFTVCSSVSKRTVPTAG